MQLSVASDENSQYTWIASFFGGFNDFVNSDLGGNEGLLAISSLLEKKATGWTDSMLGSAEKTMNNALLPDTADMLSPGSYEGSFAVLYYDPDTGEKAMVDTEIPLTITVQE